MSIIQRCPDVLTGCVMLAAGIWIVCVPELRVASLADGLCGISCLLLTESVSAVADILCQLEQLVVNTITSGLHSAMLLLQNVGLISGDFAQADKSLPQELTAVLATSGTLLLLMMHKAMEPW